MTEPSDGRPTQERQANELAGLVKRLEATPADQSLIDPLVTALAAVESGERLEAFERVETALAGQADELVALGSALWRQSFPGCELLGVRAFVAALRADAGVSGALDGIGSALGYVDRLEDAEPLVDEALRLTDRAPRLLIAWSQWLSNHGRQQQGRQVAREALAGLVKRLEAAPADQSPTARRPRGLQGQRLGREGVSAARAGGCRTLVGQSRLRGGARAAPPAPE